MLPWPRQLLGWTALLLVGAILSGLAVRGRFRACYSFTAYLGAVAACTALWLLWPQRFYTWDYWLLKEAVYGLLKCCLALELAGRALRAFPTAQAQARQLLLLILVATCAAIMAVPPQQTGDASTVYRWCYPRLQNGVAWLLVAIMAVVYWYHLPLGPVRKAILLGFTPYLLVSMLLVTILEASGWATRVPLGYVDAVAYDSMLAYWSYAAWRRSAAVPAKALPHLLAPWIRSV